MNYLSHYLMVVRQFSLLHWLHVLQNNFHPVIIVFFTRDPVRSVNHNTTPHPPPPLTTTYRKNLCCNEECCVLLSCLKFFCYEFFHWVIPNSKLLIRSEYHFRTKKPKNKKKSFCSVSYRAKTGFFQTAYLLIYIIPVLNNQICTHTSFKDNTECFYWYGKGSNDW